MPNLKLTYFGVPGRAEPIRLILNYGNVAFTDECISFDDWAKLKGQMPYLQVPVMDIDGQQVSQSVAIARYCAKLTGLYPKDLVEAAFVDMCADAVNEAASLVGPILYLSKTEEEKIQKTKELLGSKKLDRFFNRFEKDIKGDYYLGPKISFADFYLYNIFANVVTLLPGFDAAPYPKLAALCHRLEALPQLGK